MKPFCNALWPHIGDDSWKPQLQLNFIQDWKRASLSEVYARLGERKYMTVVAIVPLENNDEAVL